MHLTSADKRAVRDGFKFVVLRGGERMCYTTTAAEAKRECGKHGRVVALSHARYTTQNPAHYAKHWPSSRYGVQVRNPSYKAGTVVEYNHKGKIYHLPSIWLQGIGWVPAKQAKDLREGDVEQRNYGATYTLSDIHHVGGWVVYTMTSRSGNDKGVQYENKRKPSTFVPLEPISFVEAARNPSWTTTALLAGGAYVYGRSAKVREKVHGAISRAHSKLENPRKRRR